MAAPFLFPQMEIYKMEHRINIEALIGLGCCEQTDDGGYRLTNITLQVLYGCRWPLACHDCGKHTHPYQAADEVWSTTAYGVPRGGELCIPCFERRLGRPLARSDLNKHPAFPNGIEPANCWIRWQKGKIVLLTPKAAYERIRLTFAADYINLSGRESGWPPPGKHLEAVFYPE